MARVPSVDPKREKEMSRLRKLLAQLERIPAHRREDECADVRERDIRALLDDMEKS